MDSIFQYSDIFFFKIQQRLFYLLTISDDNPNKNVFVSKEYYDEVIKKNYLVIKDVYYDKYEDYDSKSSNTSQSKNYSYRNNYNTLDINSMYMYEKKERHIKDSNYDDKKLYLYDRYDQGNYTYTKENYKSDPVYQRMLKDYYNSRDAEMKPYLFKDYPNEFRRDEPPFINRKEYDDDRYNIHDRNDSRNNPNNTNNDKSIMIPKISDFDNKNPNNDNNNSNNNNNPNSTFLSPYASNNETSRYSSSDSYYDRRDLRSNMENNSNGGHKSSIAFINDNNNYDFNQLPDSRRNREDGLGESSRGNYHVKREPYDPARDRDSPPFSDLLNRKSYMTNNGYYRGKEDNLNKFSLMDSQSSNEPSNNQSLRLPRIHESISGFKNDNNGPSSTGPYGGFNDQYDRDTYGKSNFESRERFDPVRNYSSSNNDNGRYPSLSNKYMNDPGEGDYASSTNGYNKNNYSSNRYPPQNEKDISRSRNQDFRESDEMYNIKTSYQYADELDSRSRDNRSSINNLLNNNSNNDNNNGSNSNNSNDIANNTNNNNQVVPNRVRSDYDYLYLNDKNDDLGVSSSRYNDIPRDSMDPMDQKDSRDSRDTRDSRDSRDSRDLRGPRDPRDRMNDRFYSSEEKIRKRSIGSIDFINDEDVSRKRPMSNIPPMDGVRNRTMDDLPPIDGLGGHPPMDNMRNHSMNDMRGRPINPRDDLPPYSRIDDHIRYGDNRDHRYYSDITKRNMYDDEKNYSEKYEYRRSNPYNYYSDRTNNPRDRPHNFDSKMSFSPFTIKNSSNFPLSPKKSDSEHRSFGLSNSTAFQKKLENQSLMTPQLPVNAIDMLDEDSDSKQSFYPTIKYKFKNYRINEIEKERLFDLNFDYIVNKNTSDDLKTFQNVMKYMTPIIVDRFYDINDIIIHRYLLNQYINFEILEYFFHHLNKYFSNNISYANPMFLLALVENNDFCNFLPEHLCNFCIQNVVKFCKAKIKLSKSDIYRYYMYKSQIKLIILQCSIIRDLMINILNAAYIKHDVEQIKKIYNYPDIINTFKMVKACVSNDTSEIRQIIKETTSSIFYKTIQGYTPLHLAVNNDNVEVMKLILQCNKVDVNTYDNYGFSPIFYAILKKRYDVLKMLISHPSFRINYKNVTGLNPLLFTVVLRNKEALKMLLAHPQTDINITGRHNNTALINLLSNTRNFIEDYQRMIYHYFSLEGSKKNYGEVSSIMYKGGKSEEEYVTKRYILNKIENISEVPLQQNELMNMIIDHPMIDLSIKNDYYNNALFYAAKNYNIEIVSRILKKSNSFNVNERLFNGKTVFHKTIKKKSDKIMGVGARKSSSTEVMNINNIISKRDPNNSGGDNCYNENNKFKYPEMSSNSLRPILPSPSTSSNTPNSSMNTPQSSYYNDNKIGDDYGNNNYPYGGSNPRYYDQERNRNYYPPRPVNEYGDNERLSINSLYNMMTSDMHQSFINHHESVDGCQFCKSYLTFLNNVNYEYERLVQLSTEDIIRYEIIKLFLDNPAVDVNVQDDKGITPIMKAVLCQRFDLLVLILRMRLLKVDFTLKNYQNENSIQIANRLCYDDCAQLQLIHKIYLQHIYQ